MTTTTTTTTDESTRPDPAAAKPVDLCPEHARIWRAWRDHHYDPANPREWGGGHIMDSRTTHVQRRADWQTHNREQMTATAVCCLSGRSKQCNRPTTAEQAPGPDSPATPVADGRTYAVEVNEGKVDATGQGATWWYAYRQRFHGTDRISDTKPGCVVGGLAEVACDSRADAEWLAAHMAESGLPKTAVRVVSHPCAAQPATPAQPTTKAGDQTTMTTTAKAIDPATTHKLLTALGEIAGDGLMSEMKSAFDAMDWAEDEIGRACKRHPQAADALYHSFSLLVRPEGAGVEFVYRAHARELLERVAAGHDTRPATDVEIILACKAASLLAPLTAPAFGLYFRLFTRAFPEQARQAFAETQADLDNYEAIYGTQIDSHERDLRHRARVADRRPETTCKGMHHGTRVDCRYAIPAELSADDEPQDDPPASTPQFAAVHPMDLCQGQSVTVTGLDPRGWEFTVTGDILADPVQIEHEGDYDGGLCVIMRLRQRSGTDIELHVDPQASVVVEDPPTYEDGLSAVDWAEPEADEPTGWLQVVMALDVPTAC